MKKQKQKQNYCTTLKQNDSKTLYSANPDICFD